MLMEKINKNYRIVANKKHKLDCNCMSCRMVDGKTKGINNPCYKDGNSLIQHYCKCGNKIGYQALICKKCKDKEHSLLLKGRKNPNVSKALKGIRRPLYSLRMRGKNNPRYIDGRTSLYNLIKNLIEYKQWRNSIYQRDNYRCQECYKISEGDIEVHHIKPFSIILQEFLQTYSQFSPIEDKETLVRLAITYTPFWDINNGKTLCKECHRKTKNYGGRLK